MSLPFLRRDQCPCCGAPSSSASPKVYSEPRAEDMSADAHGRFLSGYTAHRVFFSYFECDDCSALYCPVYYNQEQLTRLYAHQDENMAEAPFEARRRTQEAYASLLMRHSRGGGGFLEIGADIGLFADACAQSGRFDRFHLYEPNLEVHPELARRFGGRSFEIRSTQFAASDVPAGSVSTAAMIHVLDHLLDPAAVLRQLREILEPGGVLLIVTHDTRSLMARALGRRWPPFTLQHPHLFSPLSMRRLLESAGLECVGVDKTVNYFPLTYLARAGLAVLGLPPRLLPSWEKPLAGLRLGNIGAIARRRD